MKKIPNNLIESLKTMGITEYESKVYSALVLFDHAEVKQIYEYLDAPKPSVYQSLRTLTEKGLVQVVSSKPAIYRATDPKIALRHMAEVYKKAEENALKELKNLEKSRIETEDLDIIWTLFGLENIEHSLEEMMSNAKTTLKLVLPIEYHNYLNFIQEKDIKIEIVTFGDERSIAKKYDLQDVTVHSGQGFDLKDFGELSKYFKKRSIPPTDYSKLILIIKDDSEFMYIPPWEGQNKAGLTSKNLMVVDFTQMMFNILWDRTSEVKN